VGDVSQPTHKIEQLWPHEKWPVDFSVEVVLPEQTQQQPEGRCRGEFSLLAGILAMAIHDLRLSEAMVAE
jgi:hypothetical protein